MRIIAGSARGRKFDAPKGMDTRPTLDRVKEAMFGMIQFDLPGSRILDLFSGSGNLGLEAASRGARQVLCNDHARDCALQIRQNVALLGFEGIVTVTQLDYADCIQRLNDTAQIFDFAFLDAPYREGIAQKAAELLFRCGRIREGGRIFLEHAAQIQPVVDERVAYAVETRRYGTCAFTIYEEAARR